MPTPNQHDLFNERGQLSVGQLGRIGQRVASHERPAQAGVGDYGQFLQTESGHLVGGAPNLEAWIEITGYDQSTDSYSWRMQRDQLNPNFEFIDHENGAEGSRDFWPAFEKSGKTDVAVGTVVYAWPGQGQYYIFDDSGAGGGGGDDSCAGKESHAQGGVITTGVGDIPFTWPPPDQTYFQVATPGRFKKESGNFTSGTYQLSGGVVFDVTDCLAVYGCLWQAHAVSGGDVFLYGNVLPGSPKKTSVTVTGNIGYAIESTKPISYFSFFVWYSGTAIVPKATGTYFSIIRTCS